MKVLDSRVLLKVERGLTQKIGSLEIPVGANEYEVGKVFSFGEKVEGLKEGDTVYIYSGAGKKFTDNGEEYRVISSSEIIVVL